MIISRRIVNSHLVQPLMNYKLIIAGLLVICLSTPAQGQGIQGSWKGKIVIADLTLIFNVTSTPTGYSANFDSPDQSVKGYPCSKATFKGDSLLIEIASIKGAYKARWDGKDSLSGIYSQNGRSMIMNMKRFDPSVKLPPVAAKPQTPKPPFNYFSEEVEYDNADKSLRYGATFTRPSGNSKCPTVIIISGSGTQDRDGSMFGHKLYWVLADYLTRNGIAVLRVDDRGAGKSSLGKDINGATSLSFSYDVEASMNYLESRADVDKTQVGLIGHSEGAIIAPMVAARRKDVAFIVLWGCPAIGGEETAILQGAYALKQQNIDDNAITAFNGLQKNMFDLFKQCATKEAFEPKATVAFKDWKAKQSDAVLSALKINVDAKAILKSYSSLYDTGWTGYFLRYEPATDLRKVTCPILAITGTKDTQVDAALNLPLIKATMAKTANKDLQTIALPNLNHFLQNANTGDMSEYGNIAETMSPLALKTIDDWIKAHSK